MTVCVCAGMSHCTRSCTVNSVDSLVQSLLLVGVGVDVVSCQIVCSGVCVTSSTPDHQSLPPPEKTKIHSMMCDDVDILMFR